MSGPSHEEIVERLTRQFGYPPAGAAMVVEKLVDLQPGLKEAFHQWWDTGALPPVEVEGYTAEWLMREHGLNPVAALLTLDWLAREPEAARASIQRGHDRLGSNG